MMSLVRKITAIFMNFTLLLAETSANQVRSNYYHRPEAVFPLTLDDPISQNINIHLPADKNETYP